MGEFELIRRFFTRDTHDGDILVGVGDDGAVLRPARGRDLVAVVDTLVDGVHYPSSLPAEDLGFRAVAVNLSDIAAMGARPRWMTLALTLADSDEEWLEGFARGLFSAADAHSLALVGGDTTRGDQTVVSVQILGDVDPATVITRSGAAPGDLVFVSGTPGDAAAGLTLLQSGEVSSAAARALVARFRRPEARVGLGMRIAEHVSAAIDVSDGLFADLQKLLSASRCGGALALERVPLSMELVSLFDDAAARRYALTGGDDYELCFTAAADRAATLQEIGRETGIKITRIGEVVGGDRLRCAEGGHIVDLDLGGYDHFASAST